MRIGKHEFAAVLCGVCSEPFSARTDPPLWHCPACAHHWSMAVPECKNCHQTQRPEEPDVDPALGVAL